MKAFKLLLALVAVTLILTACGGPAKTVERRAVDETIDLSGRWNDSDLQLTAEQIVRDVLSRPWLPDFISAEDRKPVVIVGTVRNKTAEHLDTVPLVNHIEMELINSGRVTFVANQQKREEIRGERMDQQTQSSEDSAKRLAAETGADFMLQGEITSIEDAEGGQKVIFYQVAMELINIETNEIKWKNTKQIKKFISQKSSKF